MSTVIRPVISENNKYWIDKHRHYELKHFCLQYPAWKREYAAYSNIGPNLSKFEDLYSSGMKSDPTCNWAVKRTYYKERMKLIEDIAKATDEDLWIYILKAVTEELSYTYLHTKMNIPCSRNTYYDRYRRFFWLLNKSRN